MLYVLLKVLKEDELNFCGILQRNEKNLGLILNILNCFSLRLLNLFEEKSEFKENEIERFYSVFNFLEEAIFCLKKNCNVAISLSAFCCEIFKS